jgi:predicted acylesterase/phospholipase RssA
MPGHDIRLLALDGGGVRGLSSLMILQNLMSTIDPDSPPKPCDYFDMIAGTSTGGLIAIMLGRLRMTVDECIVAYTSLSNKVFEKKRHRSKINGQLQGRFDAAALEQAVKQILVDNGHDEEALLKDSSDGACKVYVDSTLSITVSAWLNEPKLRVRDEQTDRRHGVPDKLPPPRTYSPVQLRHDLASLPSYIRRNYLLRFNRHRTL